MNIDGRAGDIKAEEKGGKLSIKVSAKSLKTGIGLRDKHLRGYIEADKCPDITFEVDRSKLKLPPDGKEITGEVVGAFTLHCVTKEMKFKYKAKRTGSDYHVQAFPTQPLDITDHKVSVPSYLGVTVDKKVELKIKFKLRDTP
jgi:polyisoprenoid-binding protein YceI